MNPLRFLSRGKSSGVLGMNRRNLEFIYPNNARKDYPTADDKLQTKTIMERAGVPVPRTFRVYRNMWELNGVEEDLGALPEFVIKPSQGSGGGGILVIARKEGPLWKTLGGTSYSALEIKKHLADILFGVYSFDLTDAAVVEERVRQHPEMQELSPLGLADIRLIMFRSTHVMAMSRVPTAASGGRANLHQGALGIGIDLETGQTVHAIHARKPIHIHPDTGIELLGRRIPQWHTVLSIAHAAALALPLKYIGLDISISESGPILLEANVRPGLEIQNANRRSLLDSLLASV